MCATAAGSATDRWTALRPAPLERTEVGAARIGRFVYVVGGFERQSRGTTAAVERYDIERDVWTRVRDMPVGLNHTTAAAYRGDLYVVGGYASATGLDEEVASLFRYDPGRNRWSRLRGSPSRRAAHAVGVIGHRLYVAGGARDGQLKQLARETRRLVSATLDTWTSLRGHATTFHDPAGGDEAICVSAAPVLQSGVFEIPPRLLAQDTGWYPANPTLARFRDRTWVNVRLVNYRKQGHGSRISGDGVYRSRNVVFEWDTRSGSAASAGETAHEQALRALDVDLVAHARVEPEVPDEGEVHHRVGPLGAEDVLEAALPQVFAHGVRLGCAGRNFSKRAARVAHGRAVYELPDVGIECAETPLDFQERARVGDGCVYLQAVAHDALVGQ